MANKRYNQRNEWFTTELNFKNSADMLRCKQEIEESNVDDCFTILTECGETGTHFRGSYDIFDLETSINKIISKYIDHPWAIKVVFVDHDGYFGGYSTHYDSKGDEVSSVSINDFFDNCFPKNEESVEELT